MPPAAASLKSHISIDNQREDCRVDRKIVFKIAKDGQLTVEGEGFQGELCLEKSRKYLEGLGLVTSQDKKAEYYETAGIEINALN
jgi:hypothetical protein